MQRTSFEDFFTGVAYRHLIRAIRDGLTEDGPDLTSNAVFDVNARLDAVVVAKQNTLLAGVPIVPLVLEETALMEPGEWTASCRAKDGDTLKPGDIAAVISGSARVVLRAERVILNFITHMSGVANLAQTYVAALGNSGIRLLDTRKTLPGLRYPEKYAVLVGGGCNHRLNLGDMLMLKDNHIDAAGGITPAVDRLRAAYDPLPPIEVECRTLDDVREAAVAGVSRIMLDNMDVPMMQQALPLVPPAIEVEVSGGVSLESIGALAEALTAPHLTKKADFISVGRLTHSAPVADFSMRIMQAD